MSGNRANSAAIQRRTNVGAPVQQQQQQGRQPVQTPQRGNMSQQPQRSTNQQQQQPRNNSHVVQEPMQTPKLSVSDAMALVSLRLGRVETFINSMPTLEQLHNTLSSNVNSDNNENENMRVVDENVFTNIVSRLDILEKEKTNQVPVPPQPSNTKELLDMSNNNFKDLSKKYDTLKDELFQLKNLLLSVQSFAMQTNQKLNDVITETENNKKNIPPPSLLVESSSSVEEEFVVENDVVTSISLEEDNSELLETIV